MIILSKAKLNSLQAFLLAIPVAYGFGYKPDLDANSDVFIAHNGNGDESNNLSDCSGYSRYMWFHLTNSAGTPDSWPEGSVEQHTLFTETALSPSAGHAQDDILRVAFLPPIGDESGHVMLILNNNTYECYGGHGVGSREWGSEHFMSECALFQLTSPMV